mgnify:CR=1 FL=1|tara:strand:+ start:1370 stop:3046 length:1677 start_codon:yes stop_codon:yes gene_type:complete
MNLSFLFKIDKKNKLRVFYLILAGICAAILEILSLNMIIPLASKLLGQNQNNFILDKFFFFLDFEVSSSFALILFIFIGLIFFKNIFTMIYNYFTINFTHKNYVSCSTSIYKKVMNYEYTDFNNLSSAKFINNVRELPGALRFYLDSVLFYYIEIVMIFLISLYLVYVSSKYSLIPLLILATIIFIYALIFKNKMVNWGKKRVEAAEIVNNDLISSYHNYIPIHVLNKFGFFKNNINKSVESYSYYQKITGFIQSISRNFIEIVVVLLLLFVIIIYKDNLNLQKYTPVLALYLVAFFRILPSANRLLNLKFNLKAGQYAVEEIAKILLEKNEEKSIPTKKDLNFRESIDFKNFSFKYDEKKIFENKNFSIKKNEINAIVGKSGSGKSTICKVMMGFLKPTEGNIFIDGKVDITNSLNYLRNKCGYTGQKFYLFNGSLISNISLSLDDDIETQQKVQKCLELSKASVFLNEKNMKLDDIINENGSEFSDGQRQRLAIARSLFFDPEILILDEATSFLDSLTEQAIIEDIKKIDNLTIILISHRKQTLELCQNKIDIDEA